MLLTGKEGERQGEGGALSYYLYHICLLSLPAVQRQQDNLFVQMPVMLVFVCTCVDPLHFGKGKRINECIVDWFDN